MGTRYSICNSVRLKVPQASTYRRGKLTDIKETHGSWKDGQGNDTELSATAQEWFAAYVCSDVKILTINKCSVTAFTKSRRARITSICSQEGTSTFVLLPSLSEAHLARNLRIDCLQGTGTACL